MIKRYIAAANDRRVLSTLQTVRAHRMRRFRFGMAQV